MGNLLNEKYQIVLIRKPHQIANEKEVSQILPKLIAFKTLGYQAEYGPNVLPFDSSDFVASHLLLCEKSSLSPVLGFKSVTLEVCDDYRIPFPMLGMLESSDDTSRYTRYFEKLMEQKRSEGLANTLAYNGSFTIHPELRKDKILMKSLWEMTFSLLTNYYIENEIDHVVAICSTTFNVHKKKAELGWNFIEYEGTILAPYSCRHLFDSSFVPMELVKVKQKSEVAATPFKDMWKDRIILDLESYQKTRKHAA